MADKVWLYLVVSSDAQEESLEAQRRWGFEEAARIGAFVDPGGIFEGVASGKHGARTILLDLIARLKETPKAQRPSRVLMVRLDRVGRMPLDAISAMNDIRKLGVVIRTRTDGDLTFARVIDMVGPVFASLQSGFENEVRSDRSRAGHKRRRDEGKLIPAKPPYGVTRGPDGKAAMDPVCGPIIRELFERWASGEGPADLVKWLRASAPPRIGRGGKEYRLDWSLSHVYKAVHLGTYRGVVIDEDLWQRAQRRKRPISKPGPGGHVYPFAGLRCSCGDRLRPRTNTSPTRHILKDGRSVVYPRKKKPVWYVCQSMKHNSGPKFRSFREDKIEEQWLKVLEKLRLGKGALPERKRPANLAPRIEAMSRRLDVLLASRDRVHSAFEEGVYDAATMQRRLSRIEEEERRLQADIAATQAEYEAQKQRNIDRDRAADLIKNAAAHYRAGTREERAALNAALFAVLGTPRVSDGYILKI